MGWIARVAVAVLSCLWWAPGLYAQTQDTVAQADTSATRWASDSLPAGAAPAAWPMTQRPPFNPGLAPLHLPWARSSADECASG